MEEVSAPSVISPGEEEPGDSDRGEGEWSLLEPGPGDTRHGAPSCDNQSEVSWSVSTTTIHQSQLTLRDWRLELALSMPAISAEARLLDSFLKRLLVFRRLSASRFLCRSLAAVTFLL